MNNSPAPTATNRTGSFVLLTILAATSLAVIWWYRPANRENRYNRMTRVELEQLATMQQHGACLHLKWQKMGRPVLQSPP